MRFENIILPEELQRFLSSFVEAFTQATEIWLFGSRVDGTARPDSDWDLIVLGEGLTPEAVKPFEAFRSEVYPLFIGNIREDEAWRPWPRQKDGLLERIQFSTWRWKQNGYEASYESTKTGRPTSTRRAVRVWLRTD